MSEERLPAFGGPRRTTYNDPEHLAERHDISGQEDVLSKVSNALSAIATGESG